MDPLELIDKRHIVLLKGKPHPCYPGVLEAAMKQGLLELSVKLIQAPTAENGGLAICEATACFPGEGRERIFVEIGDCDGGNCGPHIAPHRVRMAATRAKGRALRDALGIGVALAEEMSNGDGEADLLRAVSPPKQVFCTEADCGCELTKSEISASAQRGWPPLCTAHGKARNAREKAAVAAR